MKSSFFGSYFERLPKQRVLLPPVRTGSESESKKKRFWRWGIVLAIPVLFLGFLFLGPLDWLLGWILIYETPMQDADVVLADGLGGNLDRAIELYREGHAKAILIMEGVPEKYRNVEAPVTLNYFIKKQCLESGVLPEHLDSLPRESHTMLERQCMLRDWIRKRGCRSYMQFSGLYSTRLKKTLHEDTFPENDVTLVIHLSTGKGVRRKEWIGIQNTLIRMVYWTLVYRPQIRMHNAEGLSNRPLGDPAPTID